MIAPSKSPLIIGHRGASALAPENTLAAFARAFADGADGIELDVRLTRDGVPVVIHDSSLQRTGRSCERVSQLSSERSGQIDVGSWFNRKRRDLAQTDYAEQTVPTLDAVFKLMANSAPPETIVYVEMKTGRRKSSNLSLSRAVVETIHRHNFQQRAIVISFNPASVASVKEIDLGLRTGALFSPRQRATKSVKSIVSAAKACQADEILLHHLIAKPKLLAQAHEAKLTPVIWTVDDAKWLSRARQHGVHTLMTNNPAKMLAGRV